MTTLIEIPAKHGKAFINLDAVQRIELEEVGDRFVVRFSGVNGSSDFHFLQLDQDSSILLAIRAWIEKGRAKLGIEYGEAIVSAPRIDEG